jgi:hypothetical protein
VTEDRAMDLILAYGRWCHAKGRAGVGTTSEEWKLLDDRQDDTKAALRSALLAALEPQGEGVICTVTALGELGGIQEMVSLWSPGGLAGLRVGSKVCVTRVREGGAA